MANRQDFKRLEDGGKAGCLLEYLQQERHLEKSFLMKPKSEQERKFGSLT